MSVQGLSGAKLYGDRLLSFGLGVVAAEERRKEAEERNAAHYKMLSTYYGEEIKGAYKPTIHSRLTLCRIRAKLEAKKKQSEEDQRRWIRENWINNKSADLIEQTKKDFFEKYAKKEKKWWEFWK